LNRTLAPLATFLPRCSKWEFHVSLESIRIPYWL